MHKPRILITKDILQDQLAPFSKFLDITCKPFIKIELLEYPELENLLSDHKFDAIAFTSQNAILAIKKELTVPIIRDHLKNIKLYAVGNRTKSLLAKFNLYATTPTIQDADGLASLIKKSPSIKLLLYLKGNLSSSNFSKSILSSGIHLEEIIVYNTQLVDQEISNIESFDGFVFYSSSAVDSFVRQYAVNQNKAFFAIGSQTALRLNNYEIKNITIPDTPDTNALILAVKEHFIDG